MRGIGDKLVIATHNPGKLDEIKALLARHGIECVGAQELDLPDVEETGVSFVDNAELKARAAADLTGLPALADDSGLCVDALGGMPGIFSARWAEERAEGERDFGQAMKRVWEAVEACGPRATRDAHFACALAIAWPNDGQCEAFEGRVNGALAWPPRGDRGFGYDPVFVAAGHEQTFGEMDPAEKHAISHRAEAFKKLMAALK